MRPHEKPGLSVHALILFADIKGDKVTDITRHCVFKNPLHDRAGACGGGGAS